MKKIFLLILTLICSVFVCNAQNTIETSPFVNVPISVSLHQPSKSSSKNRTKKMPTGVEVLPDYSPLEFNLKFDYFRLPGGYIAAFFTAQIANEELVFETVNKTQTSRVEIFAKITSIDKKVDGFFEEMLVFTTNNTNGKIADIDGKQSYIKGVMLSPNDYKITFLMRDSLNGRTGMSILKFTIPDSTSMKTIVSSPINLKQTN